jgi:hypothetical protein
MRVLDMISGFRKDLVVFEDLAYVGWAGDEDIPMSSKEDFDGSIFRQWFLEILPVEILLVDFSEKWDQGVVEWNGWAVLGEMRRGATRVVRTLYTAQESRSAMTAKIG